MAQAVDDAGEAVEVDPVDRVERRVVVVVPEERGVGDHQGVVARPARRPSDRTTRCPGSRSGAAAPSEGKAACSRNVPMARRTSERDPKLPTNATKFARARIEEPDGERVVLGLLRVVVEPDRLEAQHGDDPLALRTAALRVDERAHVRGLEVRRLLVHEPDESQRPLRRGAGERAREREGGDDPGPVVVGAGTADHRVVVRPHHHDLRGLPRDLPHDVVDLVAAARVGLTRHGQRRRRRTSTRSRSAASRSRA